MAYCSTTDVQLESGTAIGTATSDTISQLITRSDAEINDILTQKGVTAPSSATQLKTASIALTIAKLKRRQSHELSRPNSLSLGGDITFSTSPETEALALEQKAKLAIEAYINYVNGTGVRALRTRSRCC